MSWEKKRKKKKQRERTRRTQRMTGCSFYCCYFSSPLFIMFLISPSFLGFFFLFKTNDEDQNQQDGDNDGEGVRRQRW